MTNLEQELRAEIERLKLEVKRLKEWYQPRHSNIFDAKKAKIPAYSKDLVRKVGRQKINFTDEQRAKTRELLRGLGMI